MRSVRPFNIFILTLLMLTASAVAGPGPAPINTRSGRWWTVWDGSKAPKLEAEEINITSVEGQTASLPCRVLHLQDKTVSWIRVRDLTVLAVETITVTTDNRFSVKHPPDTEDWILEIQGALVSDAGTYDCQINTYPKKSTRVNLRVLGRGDDEVFLQIPASDSSLSHKFKGADPLPGHSASLNQGPNTQGHLHPVRLRILGQSDSTALVTEGKALGVTCEATGDNLEAVHASSRAPGSPLIEWTVDEVPVAMLLPEEKVEVYEDWKRGQLITDGAARSVLSHLTIFDLSVDDSGTYSCHAPHAVRQSIPVSVIARGASISPSDIEKLSKYNHADHRSHHQSNHPEPKPSINSRQMDAAAAIPRPKLLSATHGTVTSSYSRASCPTQSVVLVTGAAMLAIMILNCAMCFTLYCKHH